MEDKTVLVTGAGTGIGRGIALEFAREGAKVCLHYYNEEEGVGSAIDVIEKAGGSGEAFQADFRSMQSVRELADSVTARFGTVDVLINNAGITANIPFADVTEDQFETLVNVNLRAAYFLTQFLTPGMVEQGHGTIVNFGSLHASSAMIEHSLYAATKAAIEAATRGMALELAPKGIRVNCVVPGWCLTENHYLANSEDFDFEKSAEAIPAGSLSTPSDFGRLLVFLAGEDAHYFVGETIKFTGGLSSLMANGGDFRKRLGNQYGKGYVQGLESIDRE